MGGGWKEKKKNTPLCFPFSVTLLYVVCYNVKEFLQEINADAELQPFPAFLTLAEYQRQGEVQLESGDRMGVHESYTGSDARQAVG